MPDDRTANEIQDKLVRDNQQIVERELDRVQSLLWLDSEGNAYPMEDLEEYSQHDQILLQLVGRLYAYHGDLVDGDTLSTSELADILDYENKAVSARTSELGQYIESPARGKYRVKEQYISKILDMLEGDEE